MDLSSPYIEEPCDIASGFFGACQSLTKFRIEYEQEVIEFSVERKVDGSFDEMPFKWTQDFPSLFLSHLRS